jgi:enoyl-CoA hydratase/carnithine racemase
VLRSEGRVFCSGAELSFLEGLLDLSRDEISSAIYDDFQSLIRAIVNCPVPVIARVQGPAVGAGCDVALACDLIVAAEEAWFEESWINIGAISALAGGFNLVRTVGRQRALDLLLTARRLNAVDAAAFGLVRSAVPLAELDDEVAAAASAIAAREHAAVVAMKRLVRTVDQRAFEESLAVGLDLQADLLSSPALADRVKELKTRLDKPRAESSRP